MSSSLTLYNRGTNDLIYSYSLSSAYRSPWVYSPSGADLHEPDIWEIVRNQTDMLAEIERRNNNIVRPWRVAPNYHASYNVRDKTVVDASKRLAAIAHEGLSHCDRIDEARILLSESYFLGRKYAVTYWEPVWCSLDGTPEMTWWLPYKIKDLDRRRIHWVPDWVWVKSDASKGLVPAGSEYDYGNGTRKTSETPHPAGGYLQKSAIHLEMYNTDTYRWERVSEEQRRNMIEYVAYDSEDRLGHGRGALEAGYFTHYFLTNTFKKISEGIDRYANGVLIGKIDTLRNASTDRTTGDLLTAMQTVLNTYRSDHYIVLGDNDEVELKEPTGTGISIAMDFMQFLIAGWARLCNGSVRPAGHNVGDTSSRAQAQTEEDTSETFYQNARNAIDHVMNRDFLGAFLYHNQENIQTLGLDRAKAPKFTSEQIKRQEPEIAIDVMSKVLGAGQPILKSEFYDRVELTPPHDDDDVVEPMMQADPLGGGFGGTGEGERKNGEARGGNSGRGRQGADDSP